MLLGGRPGEHPARRTGPSDERIVHALETRPGYELLHSLIDYAANRLAVKSFEDPTWSAFECIVNGTDAMAWLDEDRPDVAAGVQSTQSWW